MNKIPLRNSHHPLYNSFKALYSVSFPIFGQRTEAQQEYAFLSANYHLMAYEENAVFIGFIAYWEFDAYVYIEHCAIDRGLRGQGYGSRLLSGFIEECRKGFCLKSIRSSMRYRRPGWAFIKNADSMKIPFRMSTLPIAKDTRHIL